MRIEHCDDCSGKPEGQSSDVADVQCKVCNKYFCDYCAQLHHHYYDKERSLWREIYKNLSKG